MLAPVPGDTEPGPHALSIALPRRSDLVVHVPKRVTSGRLTAEAIVLGALAARGRRRHAATDRQAAGGADQARPGRGAVTLLVRA